MAPLAFAYGAEIAPSTPEADLLKAGEAMLSDSRATEHGRLRFRPGSRVAGQVAEVGAFVERELTRVCALLDVPKPTGYTLLLFEDDSALHSALNLPANYGGITQGKTVAVTFDNHQAIAHEMNHVVADAAIGPGANSFLVEGLADALLESSLGVPLHTAAKYYLVKRRLPALSDVVDVPSFAEWSAAHPGVHLYDVAHSWMRFLLDTRGPAKLKRYYREGRTYEVYGVEAAALEKEWRAMLEHWPLGPEAEAVLATRYDDVRTPLTLIAGGALTFEAPRREKEAEGVMPTTYRWRKNGVELPGVSAATLSFDPLAVTDGGEYDVAIRNGKGADVQLDKWQLAVVDPAHLIPPTRK